MPTVTEIALYLDRRIQQTEENIRLLRMRNRTDMAAIYMPEEIEQVKLGELLEIRTHITPQLTERKTNAVS